MLWLKMFTNFGLGTLLAAQAEICVLIGFASGWFHSSQADTERKQVGRSIDFIYETGIVNRHFG